MHYSNISFSQTPVEQVMREAATELYLVAHDARGRTHMRLQNPPPNLSREEFENQLAEAAWDDLLLHRAAYEILFSCGRELWAHAPWAKVADGSVAKWSDKGLKACLAMGDVQKAYSRIQVAAMLLPGSEAQQRSDYWSLLHDPKNPVEQEMVSALKVLKSYP